MTALRDAALQYAGRGWRVIPLHTTASGKCSCKKDCGDNAGKHPRVKQVDGRWGSSDAAQVAKWWGKWPESNIGLETGHGLVVVDVDDAAGAAELAEAVRVHGGLAETLVALTGRGFHLYFAGKFAHSRMVGHLLVRGAGAYVVAPPSLHRSGRRYAWRDPLAPIAPLANWMKEWEQPTVSAPAPLLPGVEVPTFLRERRSTGLARSSGEPWTAAEQARIEAALAAVPPSCSRETWLSAGMALHSLHWERPDGTDIGFDLWREWSAGCPDKFSDHDVETRWNSFRRSGITIGTLFHLAQAHGWDGNVPGREVVQHTPTAQKVRGDDRDVTRPPAADTPLPGAVLNGINGAHALPAALTAADPIRFPDRDARGKPRSTVPNAHAVLRALGISCRHDTFHERLQLGGRALEQFAGEASDNAEQALRVIAYQEFGADIGRDHMHDAIVQACLQDAYDPVLDYLAKLQWDGKKRLQSWLTDYLGAERTELNAAVGRLALTAAVRRIKAPGTKFDQIIVLESEEGYGKSSAIQVLAHQDNFSDQDILTLSESRQQEAVQGIWLYEIADLVGKSRADVDRVKSFCSRQVDRVRPAYGRHRIDKARRCIFFGTTNELTYLRSQTGNRRFWPVKVGRARLLDLERDRDQLWAEAAIAERASSLVLDERLWGSARAAQEGRREHDGWDDILAGLEHAKHGVDHAQGELRVTTRHLIGTVLGIAADRITDSTNKRLAHAMRRLGWSGPSIYRGPEGVTVRGYSRSA